MSDVARQIVLSVVIPTYNEAARLPRTLREITPYLAAGFRDYEIVIVDDNSPDGTGRIVEEAFRANPRIHLISHPGRLGKGVALRHGCMAAKGDMVLFMDADHSTPIDELERFFPVLIREGADVAVGVRTYQEDESRGRRIIGMLAQLLAHIIVFRKAVVDSQCGFKLFTARAVGELFPFCRVNGGMIDVELFYLMHKKNLRCYYQPVHWRNKPGSSISILACMLRDPVDMVKIRVKDFLGLYAKPVPEEAQPWVRHVRK
jgi:dolichyl-phosphate beta-glucosyltransferase